MAIAKILVSALIIWIVGEVGKKSGVLGGLILSLPLTSILALSWLWLETRDSNQVATLSLETLIFVVPSFVFFILLWLLISRGMHFYFSFSCAILATLGAYFLFFKLRGGA